jgi:MerR family transcriptional regulator, redox-sensitive transcriptional activator SoxR
MLYVHEPPRVSSFGGNTPEFVFVPAAKPTTSTELEVKRFTPFLWGMSALLTIGEVSRRSGVAASALRFYEARGLITSERAASTHRRYARPVLRRIAFIVFAQRIGLTLDEIGTELGKLPPEEVPSRQDWSRLSSTWSSRIDDRIHELERLKLGLTRCIGCGCLSIDSCSLANPRDRAAGLGAGPRYWLGDLPPSQASQQASGAPHVARPPTGAATS